MQQDGLEPLTPGGEQEPELPESGASTCQPVDLETVMHSGDFYVKSTQAPRFGVTKATLARWAKIGAINRYGTPRKALYLASEIVRFLKTGQGVSGEPVFKKVMSPLEKKYQKNPLDEIAPKAA